ncbi:MAG: hypothetical protein HY809_06525 [Nitrospirae bacterium]|nr:hypothetical protein [Nitrospirota bacterium]
MLKSIAYLSIVICLLFTGCAGQNREINELAQAIYSQAQLKQPLPPHEFKSDGCSYWPDGDWEECCVRHDVIYWQGGTRSERRIADANLKACVSETGHPVAADLMHWGVRIGGVWWLPTSFRWGFGWDYPQYSPANVEY